MRKAVFGIVLASLALGGCYLSVNTALGPNVARARAKNAPVLIYAMGVPGEISVPGKARGAVPVFVQFLVTDKQPIEQISFALLAYSQRGNPVRDRKGKQLQMILTGPGTFDPDKLYEVNSFHSSPAGFPGSDVACVELRQMTVTYADGIQKNYTQPDLNVAIMPQLRHGCDDLGAVVYDRLTDNQD